MGTRSGYLMKKAAFGEDMSKAVQHTTRQYMLDTLQIALHRSEGFGYERIERVTDEWERVRKEYDGMIDFRDPEADIKQEHMDREFREICKGHAEPIPYAERYPYTKGIKYGRKK